MDTQRLSQTVQPLLDWYRGHARVLPWRADREPYHVWLSEIMLQQTRVEAVRGYYARFLAAAPDVFALAALPEAQLLKLWEGLGYYNRARKAQECAREIAARGGVWPDTVEGLLALPGIGPYTAGAIASICFERPAAAVDGNVLRVCARVLDDATPIDNAAHKAALTAALSACYPAGHCGDFTQALMELGATVCGPNRAPQCEACPIAAMCLARAHGTAAALPVKAPKRAKRAEEHTVFCLRCGDRLAVERRPDSGLLAGLWQLPNTPGLLDERQAGDYASGQGLGDVRLRSARDGRHIFTHIVWTMRCYTLECSAMPPRYHWATPDELQHSRRREHEDIIHNVAAGEIRHTQHGVEDRRREQDVHHQRRDTLIELRPRDADARTKVAKEHDEHQHGHLGKNNGQIHFSLFLSFLGFSRRAAHGAVNPV